MWEIDIAKQAVSFLEALCLGVLFCILFDILRSVQSVFKFKTVFLFFTDFLVTFICALAAFCFLLATTLGEIRFYVILGIGLGFILIRKTISKFVIKFLSAVFATLLKGKATVSQFLRKILKKSTTFIKNIKNYLKNSKKSRNKTKKA